MIVTLKHVAAEAGVSYQTVWRAIHDEAGILPATRQHVMAVALRLGYRRNRIAGSLRTQTSGTIGLVVLDVRDPHAAEVTLGVEREAALRGVSVLLANTGGDDEREQAAVTSLMERRVDGLILSPAASASHAYFRHALPKGFPLVAINRGLNAWRCHTILSDGKAAARAARYFIEKGHTRIAGLFGDVSIPPLSDRHAAFAAELAENGTPLRQAWTVSGENNAEAGRLAIQPLFKCGNPPTALFAATSRLTEGALYGLREAGLRHGHDVTLVGFDFRHASLLDPPLPVLSQPGRDMGRVAVDVLMTLRTNTAVRATCPLAVVGLDGSGED